MSGISGSSPNVFAGNSVNSSHSIAATNTFQQPTPPNNPQLSSTSTSNASSSGGTVFTATANSPMPMQDSAYFSNGNGSSTSGVINNTFDMECQCRIGYTCGRCFQRVRAMHSSGDTNTGQSYNHEKWQPGL